MKSNKRKVVRPKKVEPSVPEPTVELEPTHVRLKAWSEKMGYFPSDGGQPPSLEDLKKLCRPETIQFWEQVMTKTVPKDTVSRLRQKRNQKLVETRNRLQDELRSLDAELELSRQDQREARDSLMEKKLELKSRAESTESRNTKTRLLCLKREELSDVAARNRDIAASIESDFPVHPDEAETVTASCKEFLASCLELLRDLDDRLSGNEATTRPMSESARLLRTGVPRLTAADIHRGLAALCGEQYQRCFHLDCPDHATVGAEIRAWCQEQGVKTLEESVMAASGEIGACRNATQTRAGENKTQQKVQGETFAKCLEALIKTEKDADTVREWLQLKVEERVMESRLQLINAAIFRETQKKQDVDRQFSLMRNEITRLCDQKKKLEAALPKKLSDLTELLALLDQVQHRAVAEIKASHLTVANVAATINTAKPTGAKVKQLAAMRWTSVASITLTNGARVPLSDLLSNVLTRSDVSPRQLSKLLDGFQRVEEVIMNIYFKKTLRNRLQWIAQDHTPHPETEIEFDFNAMKQAIDYAGEKLTQSLTDFVENEWSLEKVLQDLPMLMDVLNHNLIGDLIPDSRKVQRRTYRQWFDKVQSLCVERSRSAHNDTLVKQERVCKAEK